MGRSDDKKRIRLNIITHLLEHIPYTAGPKEKITLPKRQKAKGYTQPEHPFRYVPEKF
ncbi:hypothetical protein D3C85_1877670 [compost metagenome]